MRFQLTQAAQKRWRRLNGRDQFDFLLQGGVFLDGVTPKAAGFHFLGNPTLAHPS
jgi:hypothetical protein